MKLMVKYKIVFLGLVFLALDDLVAAICLIVLFMQYSTGNLSSIL